jgi:hypothetical protein
MGNIEELLLEIMNGPKYCLDTSKLSIMYCMLSFIRHVAFETGA